MIINRGMAKYIFDILYMKYSAAVKNNNMDTDTDLERSL